MRIKAACDRCRSRAESVTLLAVTKTQPPETVNAAAVAWPACVRRK